MLTASSILLAFVLVAVAGTGLVAALGFIAFSMLRERRKEGNCAVMTASRVLLALCLIGVGGGAWLVFDLLSTLANLPAPV